MSRLFSRYLVILSAVLITATSSSVFVGCDTSCPETTTIEIINNTGSCFDVAIMDVHDGFTTERRICSSEVQRIFPSQYEFVVYSNGVEVYAGSRNVSCGERVRVNLGGASGFGREFTVQGVANFFSPDGYMRCALTNPRRDYGIEIFTEYNYWCSNGYSNQVTVPCVDNCGISPNSSINTAPLFDPRCSRVDEAECFVRIFY